MSILLDALRKSERSQRPVEVPDIHSEYNRMIEPRPARKRLLFVLLLVVVLLVAWIAWRQYQPSSGSYQPPVAMPVKQQGGAIRTPGSSEKQQRTPVENYQRPTTKNNSRTVVQAEAGAANTDQSGTAKRKTTGAKTAKSGTTKTATAKPKAAKPKTGTSKPQVADTSAAQPKKTPAKKSDGQKSEVDKQLQPISYWELPDGIRSGVPDMKFSVLVYAAKPADRFVLVNGRRLMEGDSYQQGLVVRKIRRDGVVFSYRRYNFLVER